MSSSGIWNNEGCGKREERRTCRIKNPQYVADVSTGYVQTKAANYYKGNAEPIEGNVETTEGNVETVEQTVTQVCTDKAYFILYNPRCSEANLFINKIYCANLTEEPLLLQTYLCARPKDNFDWGDDAVNCNTCCCGKRPCGKIGYGKNLTVKKENPNCIFTVEPYKTFIDLPNGCILLAPGKYYIVEVQAIDPEEYFKAVCSFEWWEEPACIC